MNKQTSINTTLTALADRPFAEEVMGKTFTPVQDRWSPGALISSLFAVSIAPILAIFGSNQVLAYNLEDAANATITDDFKFAVGDSADAVIVFEAVESLTKAKELSVDGVSIAITPTGLPAGDAGDIVAGVLLPTAPSYTILSLANKLESLAIAQGKGYVVIVEQETEVVTLYLFADTAAADAALATARSGSGGTLKVAFDTPISPIQPSSPKLGWE